MHNGRPSRPSVARIPLLIHLEVCWASGRSPDPGKPVAGGPESGLALRVSKRRRGGDYKSGEPSEGSETLVAFAESGVGRPLVEAADFLPQVFSSNVACLSQSGCLPAVRLLASTSAPPTRAWGSSNMAKSGDHRQRPGQPYHPQLRGSLTHRSASSVMQPRTRWP